MISGSLFPLETSGAYAHWAISAHHQSTTDSFLLISFAAQRCCLLPASSNAALKQMTRTFNLMKQGPRRSRWTQDSKMGTSWYLDFSW